MQSECNAISAQEKRLGSRCVARTQAGGTTVLKTRTDKMKDRNLTLDLVTRFQGSWSARHLCTVHPTDSNTSKSNAFGKLCNFGRSIICTALWTLRFYTLTNKIKEFIEVSPDNTNSPTSLTLLPTCVHGKTITLDSSKDFSDFQVTSIVYLVCQTK